MKTPVREAYEMLQSDKKGPNIPPFMMKNKLLFHTQNPVIVLFSLLQPMQVFLKNSKTKNGEKNQSTNDNNTVSLNSKTPQYACSIVQTSYSADNCYRTLLTTTS